MSELKEIITLLNVKDGYLLILIGIGYLFYVREQRIVGRVEAKLTELIQTIGKLEVTLEKLILERMSK